MLYNGKQISISEITVFQFGNITSERTNICGKAINGGACHQHKCEEISLNVTHALIKRRTDSRAHFHIFPVREWINLARIREPYLMKGSAVQIPRYDKIRTESRQCHALFWRHLTLPSRCLNQPNNLFIRQLLRELRAVNIHASTRE